MTQQETDELEGFEVFRPELGMRGLMISINRNGKISISRRAYEALGRPSHLLLGHNRARRMIGVRAANGKDPHAAKVSNASGTAQLTVSAFLKYLGLCERVTGRFPAEMTDGGWLAAQIEDWPEKDTS